jgi:hypothetical protein
VQELLRVLLPLRVLGRQPVQGLLQAQVLLPVLLLPSLLHLRRMPYHLL